jgi:hypothetical protein
VLRTQIKWRTFAAKLKLNGERHLIWRAFEDRFARAKVRITQPLRRCQSFHSTLKNLYGRETISIRLTDLRKSRVLGNLASTVRREVLVVFYSYIIELLPRRFLSNARRPPTAFSDEPCFAPKRTFGPGGLLTDARRGTQWGVEERGIWRSGRSGHSESCPAFSPPLAGATFAVLRTCGPSFGTI